MRLAAPLRWLPLRRPPAQQLSAALRRGRALHAAAAAAAPPGPPPTAAEREARLAANQLRTAGSLLSQLAPLVRTDAHVPSRLRELAGERVFNSSSRRLYRELLWTAVRHWCAAARLSALRACVTCAHARACALWLCALLSPRRRGWVEPLLSAGGEPVAAAAAAWLAGDTAEARRLRAGGGGDGPLGALGPQAADLEAARATLQALCPALPSPLCAPDDLAAPPWFRDACTAVRAASSCARVAPAAVQLHGLTRTLCAALRHRTHAGWRAAAAACAGAVARAALHPPAGAHARSGGGAAR
jgi:hypothetical protein